MDILKKLNKILDKKQKRKIIILLIMMIIGGIAETIGVALILPFVSAIIEPNLLFKIQWVDKIYHYFHFESTIDFILVLAVGLILIYIFKNIYLLLMYWVQYNFVYNNQMRMSSKLMNVYMNKPYEYFLASSTPDIIRTVTLDITNMFQLISTILLTLTEFVVALLLIIFLFFIDIKMTLFISILLGFSILIIKQFIKPALTKSGLQNQKYYGEMIKWIEQGIKGIKEIKITQKENYFTKMYSNAGYRYVNAQKNYNVASQAPRLFIETVCISGLLLFIVIAILSRQDLTKMLPQISAFAMAAVRLMPCANRINTYLNTIIFYQPSLDLIYNHITLISTPLNHHNDFNNEKISMTECIEIKDITYSYPNTNTTILENTSLVIPKSSSVAIIGSSGSGKTTLIDIILGLLIPQKGCICVDHIPITNKNYFSWISSIGYIPQKIFLIDGTFMENIALGIKTEEISEEQIWVVVEKAQLTDLVKSWSQGIYTEIGENGIRLSGGQQQRIGIARALYHDPDILIFDEATSALDNQTEAEVMSAINNLHGQKTIIIIAHRLNTIKHCDIIYEIVNKNVCTKD